MEDTRGYTCNSRSPDTDDEDVGDGSKNADDRVDRDHNDLKQTGPRIATTCSGGGVGGGRWCTSGVLSRSSTSFLIHNLLISCADRAPPRCVLVSPAATSSAPANPSPMANHRRHRQRRHRHHQQDDNGDNDREWTDDDVENDNDNDDDNSSSVSVDTHKSMSCGSLRTTVVARSQPSKDGQAREDDDDDDDDNSYGNVYGRTIKRHKHIVPSRRRAVNNTETKDEADVSAAGSCTDDENGKSKTQNSY